MFRFYGSFHGLHSEPEVSISKRVQRCNGIETCSTSWRVYAVSKWNAIFFIFIYIIIYSKSFGRIRLYFIKLNWLSHFSYCVSASTSRVKNNGQLAVILARRESWFESTSETKKREHNRLKNFQWKKMKKPLNCLKHGWQTRNVALCIIDCGESMISMLEVFLLSYCVFQRHWILPCKTWVRSYKTWLYDLLTCTCERVNVQKLWNCVLGHLVRICYTERK